MKIQALPKVSTQKLSTGERAIGRLTNVDLPDDSKREALDGKAANDLAGDIFFDMYKRNPKRLEEVPESRKLNGRLLDWMNESNGFERSRQNTVSNIAAATAASSLLWQNLTSDEAIQDAMAQQELADKAERKVKESEALSNAHEQAGNPEQAKHYKKKAQEAREMVSEFAEAASEMVDELVEDPIARASLMAATREAAQEAEDIAAAIATFAPGTGSGSNVKNDPKAAQEFLERYNAKIREIAELAGRVRGVALTAYRERVAFGPIMNRVDLTKEPQRLLPSEWALFRKDVPDILRAERAARLVTDGLIGWVPSGDAEKQGPFVCGIDDSGSMGIGNRRLVAKAVALGLAQAARATGREYILFSFSYHPEDTIVVTSRDSWLDHIRWASMEIDGGTSFDLAFNVAIEKMDEMGNANQADLMFISDGEGYLSDETIKTWRAYLDKHGCRVQYVPVGISPSKLESSHSRYFNIMEVVDKLLPLDEISVDEGVKLAEKAASYW